MSLETIIKRLQHSSSSSLPLYPALDGLRGVAILLVVLGHFWSIAAGSLTDRPEVVFFGIDITWPFQLAGHGVRLFFIMSAFLLYIPYASAALLDAPHPNTIQFYLRRFNRIYPAYLALTLTYVLAVAILGSVIVAPLPSILNIAANLLFLHPIAVFVPESSVSPDILQGTWSLVVEVYFYALLPILAYLFRRLSVHIVLSLAMIGVATYYRGVLYPLIGAMELPWQQRSVLLFNPLPNLDSFAIGMLSARLFVWWRSVPGTMFWHAPFILAFTGLAGMSFLFLFPFSLPPLEIAAGLRIDSNFWFNLSAGTLIVGMLLRKSLVTAIFSIEELRFIGVISYSLFLINVTFGQFVAVPIMNALGLTGFTARFAILISICIPACILLSTVLYIFLERPWLTRQPIGVGLREAASTTADMLRQLSFRACVIVALSLYGAGSLLHYGLAKPVAISGEILFKTADFSDANWTLGVSTRGHVLLVPFEASLFVTLKDKTHLVLEDGSRVGIQAVVDAGQGWIHVHTATVNPVLMSYPHRLIGVR